MSGAVEVEAVGESRVESGMVEVKAAGEAGAQ